MGFGTRISPLRGSLRLAVTPACAIMNYLYSLLEAEAKSCPTCFGDRPSDGSVSCRPYSPGKIFGPPPQVAPWVDGGTRSGRGARGAGSPLGRWGWARGVERSGSEHRNLEEDAKAS